MHSSFKELNYFLAVCRYGTVKQAAESLFVTPQAVSRQIIELEQELGATLFTRDAKGLQLTECGKIYKKYAESVVDHTQKVRKTIQDRSEKSGARLRLCVSHSIPATPLYGHTLAFLQNNPAFRLDRMEMGSDLWVEQQIQAAPGDIGLAPLPAGPRTKLERLALYRCPYVALLHTSHSLAPQKMIARHHLKTQNLAAPMEDTAAHSGIIEACREAGFTPHISYLLPDGVTARGLCTQNPGVVAILPELMLEGLSGGYELTVRPMEPAFPQWEAGLFYLNAQPLNQAGANYRAYMRKAGGA